MAVVVAAVEKCLVVNENHAGIDRAENREAEKTVENLDA